MCVRVCVCEYSVLVYSFFTDSNILVLYDFFPPPKVNSVEIKCDNSRSENDYFILTINHPFIFIWQMASDIWLHDIVLLEGG